MELKKKWVEGAQYKYEGRTPINVNTGVEHKGAVRRQDENSLLPLHCLTTGHAFDWDRESVIGKGTTKHTRGFIEAWNTTLFTVK